ncbi:MAG: hypothetical protein AAF226_03870, partial [Verrucomicrobiota bacterium]
FVYYGEEIGMSATKHAEGGDANVRTPMQWTAPDSGNDRTATAVVSTTYIVESSDGSSLVETITITVNGINEVIAVDNAATAPADGLGAINILDNDSDPEGDNFTVLMIDGQTPPAAPMSVALGSGAKVILAADGTAFYDPNGAYDFLTPGESAVDTFTYTIIDDLGATDIATATVVVSGADIPDTTAYQSTTDDLNQLTFNPVTQTFATTFIGDRTSGGGPNDATNDSYNSMAYNPIDGKLYAMDRNTVLILDKLTGAVEDSFVVSGPTSHYVGEIITGIDITALQVSSAFTPENDGTGSPRAFDGSLGLMYIVRGNQSNVSVIDVATQERVGILDLDRSAAGADWAFDNNTGKIWAANGSNVYSFDPITGVSTTYANVIPRKSNGDTDWDGVTPITNANDDGGTWGGTFADADGNVAFLNNDSGRIYWLNTSTASGGSVDVDFLVQGNPSGGNDGAADNTQSNDLFRPHLYLDPTDSTGSNLRGAYLGYELGDAPIGLTASGAYITDFNSDLLQSLTITLTNSKAGDQMMVDGAAVSPGGGSITLTDGTSVAFSVTIGAAGGEDFVEIQFTGALTEAQYLEALQTVEYSGANGGDVTPRFIEVVVNDGAADSAVSKATVFVQDAVPPVVIDMDGDGVEFDSVEEGILMDVDGDGQLEQTAWADEDDAVLIFDANGNGDVDGREEFAFADYSERGDATDMEGLAEAFDSDGDGRLTRADDGWENFRLWQDSDGDGAVDEGEMSSLDAASIRSIGLVSDEERYLTADGDVLVHGESTVDYTDGSTGTAADAAFAYDDEFESPDLIVQSDGGEVINLDENNGAVAVGDNCPEPLDHFPEGSSSSLEDEVAAANAAAH